MTYRRPDPDYDRYRSGHHIPAGGVHPLEFGRKVALPPAASATPICPAGTCRMKSATGKACVKDSTPGCRLMARPGKQEPAWPKPPASA